MTAVATATPGSWVTDRWNVLRTAYDTGSSIAQGSDLSSSDLPFSDAGIKTFARIQRNNSTTSVNAIKLECSLESQDCLRFVGKAVTLSLYCRVGSSFSGTGIRMVLVSGTGPDQSLRVGFTNETNLSSVPSSSIILPNSTSTQWARYSKTYIIPSNITQLGISIYEAPIGTAGAADYFDITGVQLELGSVATPFEVRPYPVELQLCQRYYETQLAYNSAGSTNNQYGTYVYYKFGVRKRSSSASITVYDSNNVAQRITAVANNTGSVSHNLQFAFDAIWNDGFIMRIFQNPTIIYSAVFGTAYTVDAEL